MDYMDFMDGMDPDRNAGIIRLHQRFIPVLDIEVENPVLEASGFERPGAWAVFQTPLF